MRPLGANFFEPSYANFAKLQSMKDIIALLIIVVLSNEVVLQMDQNPMCNQVLWNYIVNYFVIIFAKVFYAPKINHLM